MHKIKNILIVFLLIGFAFLIANSNPNIWAEEKKIEIYLWSFTDELKLFIERFEEQNPDIRINLTIVPCEDYLREIMPVLESGKNVPDVFTAEYSNVADLVESGFYEDLSAAPYKADVSEVIPYLIEVGTDSQGKLRALSWQACIGGFYYRRSVAKEYLGTGDPEKVGQMLSTPEKFLATARALKQKSGGKVKLIGSYGEYNVCVFAQRTKSFVTNNRFNIEKPILDYFDMAKTMQDEELTAGINTWSPEWFENMFDQEPDFMGYFMPTWGWKYVLKPNVRDTSGDWGLCKGPASYFWGGTWLGIYKNSKNKEAAWKFIKFVTLDRDSQEWWAKETGDFISNKIVINKIKNEFSDDLFAGQKFYKVFSEEAPKINGSLLKKYDLDIRGYVMGAVNNYVRGKMTKEEALDQLKKDVKHAFPEIIVEGYEDIKERISENTDGNKTVLSLWTFSDEIEKFARKFEKKNPDVRVNLIIVPIEEYLNKIRPVLRSGINAPDVFTAEYMNIADLVESGFYDDLSAAPYKADVSDVINYIIEVGTDSQGKLRALSWQACVGGFFYRRSIAKKYLGTDDPEKIGEMLSTPEKFLAMARTLKQKSGGKVKLISDYGEYNVYAYASRTKAFVTNNRLNIEKSILDYFDLAKIMIDEDLTAKVKSWSNQWFKNMNKEEPEFMGYTLATWGWMYVIRPNAKNTIGDWGLCKWPASYFWGGTWLGIYKNSKNKEVAWNFLKFVTLDREALKWYARKTEDFVSNNIVINEIKSEFSADLLAGQKYYEYFAEQAPKINGSLLKKYDLDIRGYLMGAVNNYVQGKMTKQEALEQFKKDVKNAFPDVIVE